MDVEKPFRLRNYRSSWEEGTGCTIWQAARATSVAPLYFPHIRFGTPMNYVDGGLNYNKPISALFDEAKHVWPGPEVRYIISIGTGVLSQTPTGNTGNQIIESLLHIAIDTQQIVEEFSDEMEHLGRAHGSSLVYVRLNVDHVPADIRLEEWKDFDKLTAATRAYLWRHDHEKFLPLSLIASGVSSSCFRVSRKRATLSSA